jgi:endonuclease/exonuclease/phosphatase family metal-dependent hydrolase
MGIALARPAQVRRLPLPRRDAWVADLSAAEWGPHAPLEIMNLHIQAPHSLPPWRTFAERRGQIAGVAAYLDSVPCSRRVLVGDLNATPLWPAYRRLARHLTDEVLGHAERVGRPVRPTWGPWPGAPRLLRIDHVMGNGVTAVQVEPIRIVGSDHDALLVDLVASDNEEL